MKFLKFPIDIIKLIFLHISYVFLGIDQEYFHIQRGNCFYKLGCYSIALGNYKTALEKYHSKDQFLKSSIGYCYLVLGNQAQSLKMYREAYRESKHPDILVGLVCAELNIGNNDEGIQIFKELLSLESSFDEYHKNEVQRIKKLMIQDNIITEDFYNNCLQAKAERRT